MLTSQIEHMMKSLPFSPDELELILFDLDGTLIDTDNVDEAKWAKRIARLYGNNAKQNARRLVMFLESPVNLAFTLLDMVGLDSIFVRLIIKLQGDTHQTHYPPVPGTPALIQHLKGRYQIGVVSTRTLEKSQQFLETLGADGDVSVIVGRDTTARIKPHPQPIQYALSKLNISPEHCLMVGDTTVDIRAGKRAGVWTCGVLCGYGEQKELERAGAHLIIDTTSDLLHHLQS